MFPIPCAEIQYTTAGEKIFGVIGPRHQLFMRGTQVHEIVKDGDEPAKFAPVAVDRFCSLIEGFDHRVARPERQQDKKTGKEKIVWRSCRMPQGSAGILLKTDAARLHLPQIRQLVSCPVLTPDLRVLGPGYHDHAGGTFVVAGATPPEMSFPGGRDALLSLLDDFYFKTPADKSRVLASFISPALRMGGWIDDDFPLDVAEAESQSGKTYRFGLVSTLYNEEQTVIMAHRGGVGSLDETVSAALIKGRPFIFLDNVRGKMDSQVLESAIRGAGRVTCRALRTSVEVDTRPFIWQLATTGAELTRDLANRSIITRLCKRPDTHQFRTHAEGDLLAHVAANQAQYLGAVFAVLRVWQVCGCPVTDESRHDFRSWCRSMDWIVQNLFNLPPLLDGHREEQERTANPALGWLHAVVTAVRESGRTDEPMPTAQLVAVAQEAGVCFPDNQPDRQDANQHAGKLLARLFKGAGGDTLVVDGCTVAIQDSGGPHRAARGPLRWHRR